MNSERFNELRKEILKRSINIADSKTKDYTRGNVDVLKHFKDGGERFDVPTMKYLAFGMSKQLDAIMNYIKTGGQHESEPIEQRISDAINYMILLEALIEDSKDEDESDA
jgi:hypothetical protein